MGIGGEELRYEEKEEKDEGKQKKEMIEEELYRIDILKQIAAVQSSLSRLANLLTEDHMRVFLAEAIQEGEGEDKIESWSKF